MSKLILPHARSQDLVITDLDDEILVYDKARDKAHCLNQTAALVWKYSNGNRTVAEIAEAMEKKLGSHVDEQIVWFALQQLEKDHLLRGDVTIPSKFNGITRREFIKSVGMTAAAITIPNMLSLTAPQSALAASCTPCGQCATTPGTCSDCCGGTGNCNFDSNCASHLRCCCFTAGTPVWLIDGTTRRIENLSVGDHVLSRDEKTGQFAAQRVEKTFVHLVPESLILHLADGKNIHTTAKHPFFADGGWVEAGNIESKMKCVTPNEGALSVMEIERVAAKISSVYNLQVNNFHTFYVGESALWVHNK